MTFQVVVAVEALNALVALEGPLCQWDTAGEGKAHCGGLADSGDRGSRAMTVEAGKSLTRRHERWRRDAWQVCSVRRGRVGVGVRERTGHVQRLWLAVRRVVATLLVGERAAATGRRLRASVGWAAHRVSVWASGRRAGLRSEACLDIAVGGNVPKRGRRGSARSVGGARNSAVADRVAACVTGVRTTLGWGGATLRRRLRPRVVGVILCGGGRRLVDLVHVHVG